MAIYLVPVDKGRRIVLDKAVVFIGRHPECDVVLTRSRKVSRKHCCIAQVNNHFMIRDLGSMNGTRVNGKRVKREGRIRLGDKVAIGDVQYILAVDENAVAKKSSVDAPVKGETVDADRDYERPLKPSMPLDLSQDYPIAIDEDHDENVVVEQSSAGQIPPSDDPYMTYDEDDDI